MGSRRDTSATLSVIRMYVLSCVRDSGIAGTRAPRICSWTTIRVSVGRSDPRDVTFQFIPVVIQPRLSLISIVLRQEFCRRARYERIPPQVVGNLDKDIGS